MKQLIEVDQDPFNADWTKQTWDLDATSVQELQDYLKTINFSVDAFKKLPVYILNKDKLPWLQDL